MFNQKIRISNSFFFNLKLMNDHSTIDVDQLPSTQLYFIYKYQ